MPRIVHFEIPARDPDSLATFYRKRVRVDY